MNRRIFEDGVATYRPTGSVLFTFKGTILPKSLFFHYLELPVSIYIAPVTQCYSCLLFGHTRKICKGKKRCHNCGEREHETEPNETPSCETKCFYCKDKHKSTSKRCPEYARQQNIKNLMALENMTYFDAAKSYKKTYISERENINIISQDFPPLPSQSQETFSQRYKHNRNDDNQIFPSQRRTTNFNNSVKRTYQQTLSNPVPNKRKAISRGFNQKEHNENLFFPNSRPSPQSRAPPQNSQRTTQEKPTPEPYSNEFRPSRAFRKVSQGSEQSLSDDCQDANLEKLFQKQLSTPEGRELIFNLFINHVNRDPEMELDDDDRSF